MKAGTTKDLGHDYIPSFKCKVRRIYKNNYGTPWDVVNDIMDGGLGVGELGVIVTPAGIGKSWTLQSLGVGVLKK